VPFLEHTEANDVHYTYHNNEPETNDIFSDSDTESSVIDSDENIISNLINLVTLNETDTDNISASQYNININNKSDDPIYLGSLICLTRLLPRVEFLFHWTTSDYQGWNFYSNIMHIIISVFVVYMLYKLL
jgi:hypothetical protein